MASRSTAVRIRNFLDNWLPPALRDSRLLMYPLLRLALGRKWRQFADFKERGFSMSAEEFTRVYEETSDAWVQGETDLNDECTQAILEEVSGSVLDVGCGRGYLVRRLSEISDDVTGCDIVVHHDLEARPGLRFVEGNIEALPFEDNAFDTVVCTHTLEHVQRIDLALAELRRVARKRLVVVVPRERPYKYSFNLHLHFFPHPWSWQSVAGAVPGAELKSLGDWFYVEPQ